MKRVKVIDDVSLEYKSTTVVSVFNFIFDCYNKIKEERELLGDSVSIFVKDRKKVFYNVDSGNCMSIEKKGDVFKIVSLVDSHSGACLNVYHLSDLDISNTYDINSVLWIGVWLGVDFKKYSGFGCL